MKNRCLGILLAGLMLSVLVGCEGRQNLEDQNKEEVQKEEQNGKLDKEADKEVEQELEKETDQKANKEKDPADEKQDPQTDKQKEDKLEIELPKQDQLKRDYTTAEGLELPAGTRIAVVAKNTKSAFWKAVRTGMEQAVDDLNQEAGLEGEDEIVMTFEGPEHEADAEGQINIIDAVLAENPQALCLAAVDMTSCGAQLETADENGIPVIVVDSGVTNEELVYTMCKTDNYEAGREAARRLAGEIEEDGEILIVASQQDTESVKDRVLGFEDEILKNHKTAALAETLYADDAEDTRGIEERMREEMEANSNIKGVFVTDTEMAESALKVLENRIYQEVQLVGVDADEKQLKAIKNGRELGTVSQNPYGMGYATIISSARGILKLENDAVIDAGYQWIDQSNMNQEENQKYLYE